MFLFILGKYVGMEFLSHTISVGLSLLRNTYQFSNMAAICIFFNITNKPGEYIRRTGG